MKSLLRCTASIVLAGLLSIAAANAQSAQTGENADTGENSEREIGPQDAVARVNGEEILLSDLLTAQTLLPPQVRQQPFEALFPQLLQLVIEQRLFAEAATEAGIPLDESFQREVRFIVDRLLQDRQIEALFKERITEEVFNAEVEVVRAEMGSTEQATARHILLSDKSQSALAAEIIARLNAGEDFAAMATEYSDDPGSAAQGGKLGTFGRGVMVPEFEAAVFSQEVGEVSAVPVETNFGLHIIIVDDRFAVDAPEDQLRARAMEGLQARIVSEQAQSLRESAIIQTLDENGILPPAE